MKFKTLALLSILSLYGISYGLENPRQQQLLPQQILPQQILPQELLPQYLPQRSDQPAGGNVVISNFYFSTDKAPVIVWAASNYFPATQYPIPSQAFNYRGMSIPNTIGPDQALSIQNVIYVTDTNITPPIMLCIITENLTLQYQAGTGEPDIRNVVVKSENPYNNNTGLGNNCTVTSETNNGEINIYINVIASY